MGRVVIHHLRISQGGLRSLKLQGRDTVEDYEGELASDIALKQRHLGQMKWPQTT